MGFLTISSLKFVWEKIKHLLKIENNQKKIIQKLRIIHLLVLSPGRIQDVVLGVFFQIMTFFWVTIMTFGSKLVLVFQKKNRRVHH